MAEISEMLEAWWGEKKRKARSIGAVPIWIRMESASSLVAVLVSVMRESAVANRSVAGEVMLVDCFVTV